MRSEGTRVRIADWSLDLAAHTLRRGGESLRLEPTVAKVLRVLVERAGEVVRREELLERAWPGRVVCDDAVTNTVIKLRRAFGDSARNPEVIETVSKVGYRLRASAVRRDAPGGRTSDAPTAAHWEPALGSARCLVIRVEPLSPAGFPGHAALEARIVAELHRCSWLHVVVAPGAPAHFALAGLHVENAGERDLLMRVVDARDGGIAWSERYPLDDAAPENAAPRIAAAIEGALLSSPEWIGQHDDTAPAEPLGSLLRGIGHMNALTPAGTHAARAAFGRAIRHDPGNARAHACMAWCIKREVQLRGDVLSARDRADALSAARRAFELAPRDPFVLVHASAAAGFVHGDLRTAIELAELSLARDPNFVRTWAAAAEFNAIAGRSRLATEQARTAVDIAAADPSLWVTRTALARTCYARGAFDEAEEHARSAVWRNRISEPARLLLAAAQVGAGRIGQARRTVSGLRTLAPGLDARSLPARFARQRLADLPGLVEHLIVAGVPRVLETPGTPHRGTRAQA